MGRRWLYREGPKWVEEGIITEVQLDALQQKYASPFSSKNILITIGFLCIGIGILSIVAAQWSLIIPIGRVTILGAGLIAAFGAGIWALRRDARALCESFFVFGVLLFGASIILIGQTYSVSDDYSLTYIVWSIAALLCAALIRSTWCGIIGLMLLVVDYIAYDLLSKGSAFSLIATAALGVICLYRSVRPQWVLTWTACMLFHAKTFSQITYTDHQQLYFPVQYSTFLIITILMYVFSSYVMPMNARWIRFPLLGIAYILCVLYLFGGFELSTGDQNLRNIIIPIVALIVWAAALAHQYWRASMLRVRPDVVPLTVFFPLFALVSLFPIPEPLLQHLTIPLQIAHFVILLSIGLFVLIRGASMSSRTQYQIGTALVLFALAIGFFAFWVTVSGFTIRAVLFLSFGVLILMLGIVLSRKSKQLFPSRPPFGTGNT